MTQKIACSLLNKYNFVTFSILRSWYVLNIVLNVKKLKTTIQIFENIKKQLRTNIGLANTLILSSFIYLIYMEGTGPCDSSKIIFGNHVYS